MGYVAIIIVVIIGGVIFSAMKNNPEVKKFIDELKTAAGIPVTKPTANSNKPNLSESKYSGLQKEIKDMHTAKSVTPQTAKTVTTVAASSINPKATEKTFGSDMSHNLTEMKTYEYKTIMSRNDMINNVEEEHYHPSENDSEIENYDSYEGSVGIGYAGEGCEEHYNTRFISNDKSEEEDNELTTLQKLIIFGDVINRPVARRR